LTKRVIKPTQNCNLLIGQTYCDNLATWAYTHWSEWSKVWHLEIEQIMPLHLAKPTRDKVTRQNICIYIIKVQFIYWLHTDFRSPYFRVKSGTPPLTVIQIRYADIFTNFQKGKHWKCQLTIPAPGELIGFFYLAGEGWYIVPGTIA
jgi:hypothetical protein